MEYLKIWTSFAEIIEPLNDSERGRLFTAMLLYADHEELPDFKGNERYIWPVAKQVIDRARAESDRLTANGSKGGRPRKNQTKPTEINENQTKPTETQKDKDKEKEIKDKVDVVDMRVRGEGLFGLTEDEIHASLLRDEQIEEAAKQIGLQITEAGMMSGRRLAEKYGLEKLLDAISKAVDVPKWAYVEGILKGGKNNGTAPEHRGNYSGNHGKPSGKYDFLFPDPA